MQFRNQSIRPMRVLRLAWIPVCLLLAACHLEMYSQPKVTTFDPAPEGLFEDGASARPLPAGTVAQGRLRTDEALYAGQENGEFVDEIPIEVNDQILARGADRYRVFCVPCHGANGAGNGTVTPSLLQQPASFYLQRLRDAPDGYLYNVITNGVVRDDVEYMYPYASRIEPEDRWAIVAFIRELQENPPEQLSEEQLNPTEVPDPPADAPRPIPYDQPGATNGSSAQAQP